MRNLLGACLLVAAAACSRSATPRAGSSDGGVTASRAPRCTALAERVRAIYGAEAPAQADPDRRALEADLLDANVDMVLADCRQDPERALPCLERARAVADLERDCLIPLDDEGLVEGSRFER
jgi:hypothetical protein